VYLELLLYIIQRVFISSKRRESTFWKKIRLNALHGEAQPHDRFTRSAAPVNSHPKEKLDEAANSQKTA